MVSPIRFTMLDTGLFFWVAAAKLWSRDSYPLQLEQSPLVFFCLVDCSDTDCLSFLLLSLSYVVREKIGVPRAHLERPHFPEE